MSFVPGMTLSQFDLMSMIQQNYTYKRREGEFSVVRVNFNLQRHTGYFLIQVNRVLRILCYQYHSLKTISFPGVCTMYTDCCAVLGFILDPS